MTTPFHNQDIHLLRGSLAFWSGWQAHRPHTHTQTHSDKRLDGWMDEGITPTSRSEQDSLSVWCRLRASAAEAEVSQTPDFTLDHCHSLCVTSHSQRHTHMHRETHTQCPERWQQTGEGLPERELSGPIVAASHSTTLPQTLTCMYV